MRAKLDKAFDEVSTNVDKPSKASVGIITAYTAASIVYGNGQRSGVITNLTIDEFNVREEGDDGLVVIPCVHHKTGAQALAMLVITEESEDVLQYYYNNVRLNIIPTEASLRQHFFTKQWIHLYTSV